MHQAKTVSKRDTPASQEIQNQSTYTSEGLNVSDMSPGPQGSDAIKSSHGGS